MEKIPVFLSLFFFSSSLALHQVSSFSLKGVLFLFSDPVCGSEHNCADCITIDMGHLGKGVEPIKHLSAFSSTCKNSS